MKTLTLIVTFIVLSFQSFSQVKTYQPGQFNQVVISPHIQVEFVEGNDESVEVISITESIDKFNVELKNKKLHLFLEDAKVSTKSTKSKSSNWSYDNPIYRGTIAKVRVTYVNLKSADLRGEEDFLFSSQLNQSDFSLSIYGEAVVSLSDVNLSDFRLSVYGESELFIKNGNIDYQKITAYGESEINMSNVKTRITKLTTYGEGVYRLHVDETLKIVSFGESEIIYSGDADLNKKMILGETEIRRRK